MASRAQKSGGGPGPRGVAGGLGGLILLGGLSVVASNALFNVDGGHRAIKYTRIGGVSKEIYSEGIYKPSAILQIHHIPRVHLTCIFTQEPISKSHGSKHQ